ncbi:MAG: LysR family transcriptional regulator [Pseudorhodoplanes sp.]|nr:HTH-type transcriptional regulator HdfR [Pseudorhodoplanes sp.]MBW7949895.1 LysR family transcriptional regulator [Pseudorhodoplanes sp.]MCL4711648.1 LysR family transcriptional regulator [Pseudorhodoplanes sp.]MCQ3941807.1 LysR family transcriptional regulator [Alphaproteobacteria bacterium]GIK81389.1 MAG: LysR family transcriptional regulator [Alphaproteobacteria bacterium]
MDIDLARTFLEIVNTGSFMRAAERLHMSQTTISARIHSLEKRLGRPLFVRNKGGASLTPEGERFLRYAPTLVQLWERARHKVAVPAGRRAVLAAGGELSLWYPWLLKWLLWMRRSAPDIALRAQVNVPESLVSQVAEGVLDIAVMYAPHHRPGLRVDLLFEERLVLVTTHAQPDEDGALSAGNIPEDYVYVDWGTDFALNHNISFPEAANPGLFVGLGPLALRYILEAGGTGYFRTRAVRRYIDSGQLHLVRGVPEFSYPAYAVYSVNTDESLLEPALRGLRAVAADDAS